MRFENFHTPLLACFKNPALYFRAIKKHHDDDQSDASYNGTTIAIKVVTMAGDFVDHWPAFRRKCLRAPRQSRTMQTTKATQ